MRPKVAIQLRFVRLILSHSLLVALSAAATMGILFAATQEMTEANLLSSAANWQLGTSRVSLQMSFPYWLQIRIMKIGSFALSLSLWGDSLSVANSRPAAAGSPNPESDRQWLFLRVSRFSGRKDAVDVQLSRNGQKVGFIATGESGPTSRGLTGNGPEGIVTTRISISLRTFNGILLIYPLLVVYRGLYRLRICRVFNLCPNCRYALTANTSRVCPECGHTALGASPRMETVASDALALAVISAFCVLAVMITEWYVRPIFLDTRASVLRNIEINGCLLRWVREAGACLMKFTPSVLILSCTSLAIAGLIGWKWWRTTLGTACGYWFCSLWWGVCSPFWCLVSAMSGDWGGVVRHSAFVSFELAGALIGAVAWSRWIEPFLLRRRILELGRAGPEQVQSTDRPPIRPWSNDVEP